MLNAWNEAREAIREVKHCRGTGFCSRRPGLDWRVWATLNIYQVVVRRNGIAIAALQQGQTGRGAPQSAGYGENVADLSSRTKNWLAAFQRAVGCHRDHDLITRGEVSPDYSAARCKR